MRTHLSFRGKLIAVSITSVILALAVSIFIDAQLARTRLCSALPGRHHHPGKGARRRIWWFNGT